MKLLPGVVDLVGVALDGLKPEAAIVVAGAGRCRFDRKVVRSIRVEHGSLVLDVSDDERDESRTEGLRGQG